MDEEADASREHGAVGREQRVGAYGDGHGDLPSPGGPEAGPPPARQRIPPQHVDHTYHDYSRWAPEWPRTGKRAGENFPSKLHRILSAPENAHTISWMPHGRAWKIHGKDRLMREVLPLYFSQSKYESFTRQLNGWGFKRLHQSGNDFNAFYHECFLRGLPHLTGGLKRVLRNQGKLIPYVEGEPNFYAIDRQFPLPSTASLPGPGPYPPPQAHATLAGAGYNAPQEPPAGYLGRSHNVPHPSNYPFPPCPQYYPGHTGDPHAAIAYVPPSGYPPHPLYATQYSQLQPGDHPRYPGGSLVNTHLHFNHYPPNRESGPIKSEDISSTADCPVDPRERLPVEDETKENTLRTPERYQHWPLSAGTPVCARSPSLSPLGNDAPLEPPVGYLGPDHYTPHPHNHPSHPCPQYYSGHPGNPLAAAVYAPTPGSLAHPSYATQYNQSPPEHYLHCPGGPPMNSDFNTNHYPPNREPGSAKSDDTRSSVGRPVDPREGVSTEGEAKEKTPRTRGRYQDWPVPAVSHNDVRSHTLNLQSTKGANPATAPGESQEGRAPGGGE